MTHLVASKEPKYLIKVPINIPLTCSCDCRPEPRYSFKIFKIIKSFFLMLHKCRLLHVSYENGKHVKKRKENVTIFLNYTQI